MVQAVLFDAGGTLFRVRGSIGEAYARIATRYGVNLPAATIESRFRAAFHHMPPLGFPGVPETELPAHEYAWWKQLVAGVFAEVPVDDFDALFRDLFDYFAQAQSWELFADVHPTLIALQRRGLRLGVVSNFDGRLVGICEGLGLAGYFDTIVMSGRVGFAKPDPRIFAVALARLGVAPMQALHVGDSEVEDVAGGRSAGVRALWLRRSAARGHDTDTMHDLRSLLAVI